MKTLEPVILTGKHVRLEPFAPHHRIELQRAADDPKLWEFTVRRGYGEHFERWWNEAQSCMKQGMCLPFVVMDQLTQAIVGSTSFLNINLVEDRLEIGSTWYVQDSWGTAVNPETKLLLMTHAFEGMGIRRVEFCVDAINTRSRAAVIRLGATQEGILRCHRYTDTGRRRDTVMFSILETEWPAVKAKLLQRLGS